LKFSLFVNFLGGLIMKFDLLLLGEHEPTRLLNLASKVEDYGFEYLWYADEKFFRDPYSSLTFISQHTSKIKLGPCVTDPFTRHPAITAMAMATMDEYSNGRGALGIGAGFSGLEAMGIQRKKIVLSTRESVNLIRKLWAGGSFSFTGETVSFHDGGLNFNARNNIPILIAAASPLMLQLAGEIGDFVMLGDLASKRVINKAHKHVIDGAHKSGRDPSTLKMLTRVNLIISDDIDAARDAMRPWIAGDLWQNYPRWEKFFNYSPIWEKELDPLIAFIQNYGGKPRNVKDFDLIKKFDYLITNEMVRDKALAGNVDGIVEQIVEISETNIEEIALYPLPLPNQDIEFVLSIFADKIMPRVKSIIANKM